MRADIKGLDFYLCGSIEGVGLLVEKKSRVQVICGEPIIAVGKFVTSDTICCVIADLNLFRNSYMDFKGRHSGYKL
jgi:hypothetical protein